LLGWQRGNPLDIRPGLASGSRNNRKTSEFVASPPPGDAFSRLDHAAVLWNPPSVNSDCSRSADAQSSSSAPVLSAPAFPVIPLASFHPRPVLSRAGCSVRVEALQVFSRCPVVGAPSFWLGVRTGLASGSREMREQSKYHKVGGPDGAAQGRGAGA
jgi:hypothetical protein